MAVASSSDLERGGDTPLQRSVEVIERGLLAVQVRIATARLVGLINQGEIGLRKALEQPDAIPSAQQPGGDDLQRCTEELLLEPLDRSGRRISTLRGPLTVEPPLERHEELLCHLMEPLARQGGRGEDPDAPDPASQPQPAKGQTRLDGFAEAHLIAEQVILGVAVDYAPRDEALVGPWRDRCGHDSDVLAAG